jgi:hypothetical protein
VLVLKRLLISAQYVTFSSDRLHRTSTITRRRWPTETRIQPAATFRYSLGSKADLVIYPPDENSFVTCKEYSVCGCTAAQSVAGPRLTGLLPHDLINRSSPALYDL